MKSRLVEPPDSNTPLFVTVVGGGGSLSFCPNRPPANAGKEIGADKLLTVASWGNKLMGGVVPSLTVPACKEMEHITIYFPVTHDCTCHCATPTRTPPPVDLCVTTPPET